MKVILIRFRGDHRMWVWRRCGKEHSGDHVWDYLFDFPAVLG